MNETIDKARADFIRAKDRMTAALDTTPDDRLNWSPSPTARTPIHQVVHAAEAIRNIHNFLDGRVFEVENTEKADKGFREFEKQFTTREAAVELFENHSAAFLQWLDGLSEDRLGDVVQLPFNLGQAPIGPMLSVQAAHLNDHAAQLAYIQTIYGDQDWHM